MNTHRIGAEGSILTHNNLLYIISQSINQSRNEVKNAYSRVDLVLP